MESVSYSGGAGEQFLIRLFSVRELFAKPSERYTNEIRTHIRTNPLCILFPGFNNPLPRFPAFS